ncbi:MAG TPA: twin-arginine translocation pathway signal [Xanthobacteraceae bacterium]|nr:twin-arginine translocation pathway signal [Xanthobacteraceae bacterium]
MTARTRHHPILPSAAASPALRAFGLALVLGLAGCANMGDSMTTAFADPAKYELYECKQLEPERKALAARQADLQGLMTKAETGVGGTVVAELAYRNEYIAVRGQSRFAEEAWQRNKCVATAPAAAAAPVAPPPDAAPARRPKR